MRNVLSSLVDDTIVATTPTIADNMKPTTTNAARMNILSTLLVFLNTGNVITKVPRPLQSYGQGNGAPHPHRYRAYF